MEGSPGPPYLGVHLKGATLPGYRAGPFRSQIHHPHLTSITRRNSDGDLSDPKLSRDKCRKYDSRFWISRSEGASYRSESPSGESGRIISDPKELSSSWESPDLAPQFSSRPTIIPLAAPASPRPQVRRSFNTFPRPWKARSRSPSPFRMKDQTNKSQAEGFHFKSFTDSIKQIKFSMSGKKDDDSNNSFVASKTSQNSENADTQSSTLFTPSFYNKVLFLSPKDENKTELHKNVYRSVAVINVSKPFPLNSSNSSHSTGDFSKCNFDANEDRKNVLPNHVNTFGFNEDLRTEIQQVVNTEDVKKSSESTSKYTFEVRGKKTVSPTTTPITKFSSSGSPPPSVHDERASARLSCDEENSANFRVPQRIVDESVSRITEQKNKTILRYDKTSEVINKTKDPRFEKQGVSPGGSGPGDREAPLIECNVQSLMQASGKKLVRKKPQIPDKLSKLRSCDDDSHDENISSNPFLSSQSLFSNAQKQKLAKKKTLPFVQSSKPEGGTFSEEVGDDKNFNGKNRTTVGQILSTLNFARNRLEELTGALGGNKKDGGKGPATCGRVPPSRPPRVRHDLEKLKKSTERLKSGDFKNNSDNDSDKQSLEDITTKTKTRNKSESSKVTPPVKQSVFRTNSSPAATGTSHDSSQHENNRPSSSQGNPQIMVNTTSSNFLLPPLPSLKTRTSIQTRDVPFRTASVSQGDLSYERSSGKASPNLKLYPACKDSWGPHTLPRCSSTQGSENTLLSDEENQKTIPMTSSFNDFGKFNVKNEDNVKLKSKSEIQLYPSNEKSNIILNDSESFNTIQCSDSENESLSLRKEIQKGSIIDNLLQSECNEKRYRVNATTLCSHAEKESFSPLSKPKGLTMNENNDNNIKTEINLEILGGNEISFKENKNDSKTVELEGLSSTYKDISIQTEKTYLQNKDSERSKRRNKSKSVEDKRDRFKLRMTHSKSFSDDLSSPELKRENSNNKNFESKVSQFGESMLKSSQQKFRKDLSIECCVVETEPKSSQCLVIRSSSFNKKDGENAIKEKEPRATSECRVVQTRQRLSLEDSEGESTERKKKSRCMQKDSMEGNIPLEEGFPTESSDSSSLDSVGIHFHKHTQCSFPNGEVKHYKEKMDRNGSRRRKKGTEDSQERLSNKREKCENENISGNDDNVSKQQENLSTFIRHSDKKIIISNDIGMSDGESRPNSYSEPESLQYVVTSSQKVTKPEKRKKTKSDPGLKRYIEDESVAYFSDSNIENFSKEKERQKANIQSNRSSTPSHGIVSQTSTDSEGRDEFSSPCKYPQDKSRYSRIQITKHFNPPVILSAQDSDTSCQDISNLGEFVLNRNISRNASPSPYLGDSDSGEKYNHRSPHGPRRYSKRPLRGPYGEMLEAEMSKSKSNSQFLNDDIFLRPRDSNSTSPRPSSPASPSVTPTRSHNMFETSPAIFVASENGSSRVNSHSIPASRSLDDSALRVLYSSANNKSDTYLKPQTAAPFSSYESDSEGGLNLLPSGPMHQRTASSPSKLFFEPGGVSEEERQPGAPSAASFHTLPKNKAEFIPQERAEGEEDRLIPAEPKKELTSTKVKHSKSKQERHSKGSKGKKPLEEEPRAPPGKKGSFEASDLRSLPEHRHMHRRHRDTRAHIIGEIYDTEKNYVENLNFLLTKYEQPLRSSESSSIAEASLVDDIFFQVPEIHDHHQRLLEELKKRLESRDANMCVGDVLLKLLKDSTVAESYLSFVNNWKTAQEAAKAAAQAKPAFRHFLAAMAKEHPGKLDLKALLITPVQRFPHYELILKRLLEHTSRDHRDHALVKEAISEVQKIAASINDIEQEALQQEQQQFILKEIENFIEGLVGLVQPDRTFIQLDLVTQNSGLGIRKERCLFLFSDILVITAIKRRSATIRKSSSLQLALLSSFESCKLKLFKFISLDDLEIGRSRDDSIKKLVKELECLEQDLQTLTQISRLVKTLHFPKGSLEDALHDLEASLRKQLMDRQGADSQLSELELNITAQEGIETLTCMFSSAEKRNKWEEEFNAAKQKLAMSADRRPPPEFMTALPIRKTRAGLQFTCAAPTLGLNAHNLKDVWVCNSDGYVGQVCVMSLQPEPTLACCNGVCNAKILSIASIPAAPHPDSSDEDEDEEGSVEEDLRKRRSESLPPDIGVEENDSQQPTMWLGTEDGSIHVYNCNDTIRTKKNKLKFQPGSPVHCIIHIENRVFASLANGDVVVYERDAQGGWNCGERRVVNLSTAAAPVTRMVMAAGKLWCSASATVRILNINNLQVEHSFNVGSENSKGVACMVCAGHGVWIAMHSSSTIRLYHAVTHECVCDVSTTSPVTKMLAGCDDIIRQHKLACLKVTALLACKDLLWVGTSAGVIITLPLPHLSHNTRRLQSPLNMVGIPHGHTGNVRFLTCVEMTPESRPSRLKSHNRYSFKGKDHPHHQSGTAAPSKLLVISGGDGYEDFRNSSVSELAGRDDSTNHLLLWQV